MSVPADLLPNQTTSWVMTWNSLVSVIPQYLERSDPATINYIPAAITMAEMAIAQELKTLGQLEVVDTTLQIGAATIAKPARWRKTVSMTVSINGLKTPLLLRKLEYLNSYAQNVTQEGPPVYYGDYDYDHWLLVPTPDQAYPLEALVYTRLQPLSQSNQTNWLTQYAPNALLFGTLVEMVLFLKTDTRFQIWKAKYDQAMQALKAEDALRVADRSAIAVDS